MERRSNLNLGDKDNTTFIIPDVRFQNEADWIRKQGGYLIYIDRDVEDIKENAHVSEKGLPGHHFHVIVHNNGTPQDLGSDAREIYDMLSLGESTLRLVFHAMEKPMEFGEKK